MRLSQVISGIYAMIAMADSESDAVVILNTMVMRFTSARSPLSCSSALGRVERREVGSGWPPASERSIEYRRFRITVLWTVKY